MQENDMKVFDMRKDGITGIRQHENEEITVTGCLGERYIGCGMKNGIMHIEGTPGNALASYLDGGSIYVDGNVQDAAADTMNAGLLAVNGSAGDALAYGMRGGRVYIRGDAGYRAGVHMKAYGDRKSILVIGGRLFLRKRNVCRNHISENTASSRESFRQADYKKSRKRGNGERHPPAGN